MRRVFGAQLSREFVTGFTWAKHVWHAFRPWDVGELPSFVSTKSGHSIFETKFLEHVTIEQCTTKAGFQTQADVHHRTARRLPRDGTSRLSGPVLLEAWAIYGLLKHKQCRGPWWYLAPPGHQVLVDRPVEVLVRDESGNLTGANNWKGLLYELDQLLTDVQAQGLYTRHECRLCSQKVAMWGQELSVRAAVCDGLTAVRREKCATYRWANSRSGKRGSRYCPHHEEARGNTCCVTDPPCPRQREPNSLVCSYHRPWETYYNNWIRRGGWHATSAARRAGNAREPRLVRYLRSMLGPRHTFGSLVCTWSCGVICGISPLLEAEGDVEVAHALDDIWQVVRHRPHLLLYDRGCNRRTYLRLHPDPTWAWTINVVDRFHAAHHRQAACTEYCSPERKDLPFLWKTNGDNEPVFRWNSSIAESSNSLLHGLGPSVSKMSSILNRFTLMTNMFCLNELTLRERLRHQEPRFRR